MGDMISIHMAEDLRNRWIQCRRIMVLETDEDTGVLRWVMGEDPTSTCSYCGTPLPQHDMNHCKKIESIIRAKLRARVQVR